MSYERDQDHPARICRSDTEGSRQRRYLHLTKIRNSRSQLLLRMRHKDHDPFEARPMAVGKQEWISKFISVHRELERRMSVALLDQG
jgi:hypothetical protein